MNLKGFVIEIVLFAVVVAAVIGAIAWVHYYYLPHMAAENTIAIQNTSPSSGAAPMLLTSTVSTSSAQATTPTTTIENNTNPISCTTNDINCFMAAAQTCSPTVAWTGTIDISDSFSESIQSTLTLKGLDSLGKCSFSDYAKNATGIASSRFMAQAEAQGLTAAQASAEIQGEARQTVGITSECTFTTSTLVQLLTDWSKGPVSADAFTPGMCTSNSTPGQSINISVPLVTSTNLQ